MLASFITIFAFYSILEDGSLKEENEEVFMVLKDFRDRQHFLSTYLRLEASVMVDEDVPGLGATDSKSFYDAPKFLP